MHASLPLLSPLLWLRFLLAAAVVVWLPGHLITGRWLKTIDPLSRAVLSISTGLFLPFVYGAGPGRAGAPFSPFWYLGFVLLLGIALGLWPTHRRGQRAWIEGIPTLDPSPGKPPYASAAAIGAVLLVLAPLLAGYGRLPAPPHIHDASNHAWITLRIVQSQSLAWRELARDAAGVLDLGYLPGLHAAAALIARLGGVAPYISVWMLALGLTALTPLAWTLLWRAWGASAALAVAAALLSAANPLGPGGVLGWGGFGQAAGFFLLPATVLALRALAGGKNRPRGTAALWNAFFAGLVLGGLIHLHASEVLVALAFVLLATSPTRPSLGSGLALLAGFVAICGGDLWTLATAYPHAIGAWPVETKTLGDSLHRLGKAAGHGPVLRILVLAGWILALRAPAWRRLALAAGILGAWYLALQSFADPLSRWLATPFYRQAPRILYLQLYFAPLWAALALGQGTSALERARRGSAGGLREEVAIRAGMGRWMRIAWIRLLPALVIAGILASSWSNLVTNYRNGGKAVPFTLDDFRQAKGITEVVPPGSLVANLWDDGSTWAMHVSGRPFLLPCAWNLHTSGGQSLHELVNDLVKHPWPDATVRLLREHSIGYLYSSDGVWGKGSRLRRADFAKDPRFEAVVEGEQSTLYRIHTPGLQRASNK